jgi:hypothetical protein
MKRAILQREAETRRVKKIQPRRDDGSLDSASIVPNHSRHLGGQRRRLGCQSLRLRHNHGMGWLWPMDDKLSPGLCPGGVIDERAGLYQEADVEQDLEAAPVEKRLSMDLEKEQRFQARFGRCKNPEIGLPYCCPTLSRCRRVVEYCVALSEFGMNPVHEQDWGFDRAREQFLSRSEAYSDEQELDRRTIPHHQVCNQE